MPCQNLLRFDEGEVLGLHDPSESISTFSASPTFVIADIGAYIERRVSVVVKRTETLPVFSGALERYFLADELDEIDTGSDFVALVCHALILRLAAGHYDARDHMGLLFSES